MKKLCALLLTLCLLCSSALALGEITLNHLGWQGTDDENMALTDEVREKVLNALKDFKGGKVEPVLVLAVQPASSSAQDTDMDSGDKSKLQDSLNDLLKNMGADTNVITTSFIHGEDVCVLCRVTPKDENESNYWIMAFVSHAGELMNTVKLDIQDNQ